MAQQIQVDLRRCGITPITGDREELEKAMQISQARAEQAMRKKLEIIKEAIECDNCREDEVYVKASLLYYYATLIIQIVSTPPRSNGSPPLLWMVINSLTAYVHFFLQPREIMKQRKAALQRVVDTQLRTSNYAYLCASRREEQCAIDESRRRCQGGSCVASTTIESTFAAFSLQCGGTCSHLDVAHPLTQQCSQIGGDEFKGKFFCKCVVNFRLSLTLRL